jgi:hypothetical protein
MSTTSPAASFRSLSFGLPARVVLFVILFVLEWGPLTYFVHKNRGAGFLLQIAIAFGSFFLAFTLPRAGTHLRRLSLDIQATPIRGRFFALHVVALLAFVSLTVVPTGSNAAGYVIASLWYAAGAAAIVLAGCAFVPPRLALRFVRTTGYAWAYALAAAIVAWRIVVYTPLGNGVVWNPALALSWKPATDLTFNLVQFLIRPFLPQMVADRGTMTIGTPQFSVMILPWCAGFEGTALMLVFSVAWLAYFRREFRFPQALLLVPAGMLVIWLSNGPGAMAFTVMYLPASFTARSRVM